MTDEAGGDGIIMAREARLRREFTDQLLRDLCKADAAWRSGGHGAPLFALAKVGLFVQNIAALDRDLGRFSDPAPVDVLFRLSHGLAGLEEGTVDPILAPAEDRRRAENAETGERRGRRPGLPVGVVVARATIAAVMEILQLAGRRRKAAAQEVAKALHGHPLLARANGEPWRVVARWRDEIKARAEKRELPDMQGQRVDFRTEAAGQFNLLVGKAKRLQQAGATPAHLVKIAQDQLDHGLGMGETKNSGLVRAKPEHAEE